MAGGETRKQGGVAWDPVQYLRFAAERARPFHDLLAMVDLFGARAVVDLGCGPGKQAAELAAILPAARVVGVDNSVAMLAEARELEVPGHLEFVLADLRTFVPDEPADVIITNATLQWVPGHLELLGRLASFLAPGGTLALQVPGNFGEPTHVLLRELATSARWCPLLEGRVSAWPLSYPPAEYLAALETAGLEASAWETTYLQLLTGGHPVLEWMKGTALRPVLGALDPADGERFLAEYGDLLAEAYPAGPRGTLLPYRRVFAVGRDPVGRRHPAAPADGRAEVVGLDHAQLAMPAGREEEGRAFYAGLLGLVEEPKPPLLAQRGGCWFRGRGTQLHLGIDPGFHPATRAHVGLAVERLDELARRLEAAGRPVRWDVELAPRRRLFTEDPFGNRIEVLEPERLGVA